MTIRRALTDDAHSLAIVHAASWSEAYRGVLPEAALSGAKAELWEGYFKKAAEQGPEEIAVFEENGEISGYTILGPCRDDDPHAEKRGEIWGLYVAPDRWGKGVGTGLTEWACRELQSRGFDRVSLWVFESNKPAREFYEAMGFVPDGAVKQTSPQAPPALRYGRQLAAR